jgi:hypothetical protein
MSEENPEVPVEEVPAETPAEETPAETPAAPTDSEVFESIMKDARAAYLNELKNLLYIAMDARRIDDVKFLLAEVEKEDLRIQQTSTVFPEELVSIFVNGLV